MTGAPSLWSRFQELSPATEVGAVAAIRCGAGNNHLLVRGARGEPTLLLATETRLTPRADVRLKHVSVQFDRKFEIAHGESGVAEVGSFCKFTCEPSDTHLHQYFVELMAATAGSHAGTLSPNETDEVVDVLLELFRKLSLPAERSVTGLWGELLLIYLAASPEDFLDAWHLRATDGFDFAFSDKRIEVKTTERASREHDFSLKQVRSERSTDIVASVALARSSSGLSTMDLARLIAERVDLERQGKLWRLVVETLGDDADAASEQRFDLKAASEAVVFVRATEVPAPVVSEQAAPFVTNVRFCSNINALCLTAAMDKELVLGHLNPPPST